MSTPTASGLDGVNVAETVLSDVDGEQGRLTIRGYSVEHLVSQATFEDVCALMWHGALPSTPSGRDLRTALADARHDAFQRIGSLGDALGAPDGMDALRAVRRAPARAAMPADAISCV